MIREIYKTFLAVVDAGSFSKASEQLFISPVAIMKQMDRLEDEIGVRLLVRHNHGVFPTLAGRSLYNETKEMLKEASEIQHKIRLMGKERTYEIRIASSLLYPCDDLVRSWNEIRADYPEFRLSIKPFQDSARKESGIIKDIGKDFDIALINIDNEKDLASFEARPFGEQHFAMAVPYGHPLSERAGLETEDLAGCRICLVKEGVSGKVDAIRERLLSLRPSPVIEDGDAAYDMDTFNRCARENIAILTFDAWERFHPSFRTIPVNWEYASPRYIISRKDPKEHIRLFMKAVSENYLLTSS